MQHIVPDMLFELVSGRTRRAVNRGPPASGWPRGRRLSRTFPEFSMFPCRPVAILIQAGKLATTMKAGLVPGWFRVDSGCFRDGSWLGSGELGILVTSPQAAQSDSTSPNLSYLLAYPLRGRIRGRLSRCAGHDSVAILVQGLSSLWALLPSAPEQVADVGLPRLGARLQLRR
jgi:hypothetical protein